MKTINCEIFGITKPLESTRNCDDELYSEISYLFSWVNTSNGMKIITTF